jgi:transketolase
LSALASEGVTVRKLAIREIPRSGKPDELVDHFGIGVRSIVEAAKDIAKAAHR